MKLAIMQPYFLPYIGYFQLIAAADAFVVYDNIKYTKRGWINRNRLLLNGTDSIFSLPLKKDSDQLNVVERELSADFDGEKLLNQFRGAYRAAPFFAPTILLLEKILLIQEKNLFKFVHHSIVETCEHLKIPTPIHVSSSIRMNHQLAGQQRVLATCKEFEARTYINPIGGVELYSKKTFSENGLELRFLKPKPFEYLQFGSPFVPWLSIVDVMMFNEPSEITACLKSNYELV